MLSNNNKKQSKFKNPTKSHGGEPSAPSSAPAAFDGAISGTMRPGRLSAKKTNTSQHPRMLAVELVEAREAGISDKAFWEEKATLFEKDTVPPGLRENVEQQAANLGGIFNRAKDLR